MSKSLSVNCPICKKKFNYYASDFRPFCTERCKEIDLGNWVIGSYSVEGRHASPEEIAEEVSSVKFSIGPGDES